MEPVEMQGNLMVESVAEYIHNIVTDRRYCPFASLEEAQKAYLLHESRVNSKYYKTYCDEWRDKYNELKWAKGYRFGKKLRPRRGTKQ